MAFDAHASSTEPRPATPSTSMAAPARGRGARVRQPARAAVRRRFDEAALAAAIRDLRTHRHSRVPG